jgi:spore coat protein U-like protein
MAGIAVVVGPFWLAMGAALPASAAVVSTTFPVSMTLQATCVMSVSPMAFGIYTGVTATATATMLVTCTSGTPFSISLGPGTGTGATVTNRLMTGPGGALLPYAMYRDSGHTENWGQTIGTDTEDQTGAYFQESFTAWGVIPAGAFHTPGAYTDTVIATVSY